MLATFWQIHHAGTNQNLMIDEVEPQKRHLIQVRESYVPCYHGNPQPAILEVMTHILRA